MNLFELITYINSLADNQHNVNTIVKSGNIYDLNTAGDIEYGAFCITQQPHNEVEGWRTYSFYLFMVDRLLADKSNKIEIQSAAIDTLSNIINILKNNDELEVSDNVTYHTFTQRFSSECGGAYCLVNISVPISDCYE